MSPRIARPQPQSDVDAQGHLHALDCIEHKQAQLLVENVEVDHVAKLRSGHEGIANSGNSFACRVGCCG